MILGFPFFTESHTASPRNTLWMKLLHEVIKSESTKRFGCNRIICAKVMTVHAIAAYRDIEESKKKQQQKKRSDYSRAAPFITHWFGFRAFKSSPI